MNKQIILIGAIVGVTLGGSVDPVYAQWDLGGMSAGQGQGTQGVGQGNIQNNSVNANGSPGQAYTNQGLPVHQYQGGYNNFGIINSPGSPKTVLPKSSMLPLSLQQTTLPKNLSGVRFNTSTGALPPTTLDSFVLNAGGAASRIYGDEGTGFFGPPPDNGFPESSTINAGISHSADNKTLTTGHRSKLPSPSGNGATYSGAH